MLFPSLGPQPFSRYVLRDVTNVSAVLCVFFSCVAAVAADKRRRRDPSDSDSYSSHGGSVRRPAESPAPRAYGSRRARPDNTRSDDGNSSKKHASSSSRAAAAAALERTTTMSSAGRSSRRGAGGGGAGWRQQARLRKAMVLAVQQKAQEDEQKGGSGDPPRTRRKSVPNVGDSAAAAPAAAAERSSWRRSTGSQYLDGGRGRGGEKTRGRSTSEEQGEAAGGHVLRRGGENGDLPPVHTGALRYLLLGCIIAPAPKNSASVRAHCCITPKART